MPFIINIILVFLILLILFDTKCIYFINNIGQYYTIIVFFADFELHLFKINRNIISQIKYCVFLVKTRKIQMIHTKSF